jgi:hypothetical protein
MNIRLKEIAIITTLIAFVGCGGGSSSSKRESITPAEITKSSAVEVVKNLIVDPIDFSKVRYQETGKSIDKKFLKSSTYPCSRGGTLEIDRTYDKFSIDNFLKPRENILDYKMCKTASGEFFNGKIRLKYTPLFPEDIELSQITEENAIVLSDKNVSILEDYTYQKGSYKLDIKKGSKFESALDKDTGYKSEKLTIRALRDGNISYRVDSLNSRIYSKDNIKRVCFQSGRVYINNVKNYFDIKEDNLCINDFVWVDGELQAGGEVELVGKDGNILKLQATDQNEISAYLNGEELEVIKSN